MLSSRSESPRGPTEYRLSFSQAFWPARERCVRQIYAPRDSVLRRRAARSWCYLEQPPKTRGHAVWSPATESTFTTAILVYRGIHKITLSLPLLLLLLLLLSSLLSRCPEETASFLRDFETHAGTTKLYLYSYYRRAVVLYHRL